MLVRCRCSRFGVWNLEVWMTISVCGLQEEVEL